jgi:hypothetical protein
MKKFFKKLLIILAMLAGFLYGWWQGYNAVWEDNDKFWEETVEEMELRILRQLRT